MQYLETIYSILQQRAGHHLVKKNWPMALQIFGTEHFSANKSSQHLPKRRMNQPSLISTYHPLSSLSCVSISIVVTRSMKAAGTTLASNDKAEVGELMCGDIHRGVGWLKLHCGHCQCPWCLLDSVTTDAELDATESGGCRHP